ncbi:hypothetical protein EKO23_20070 [Nocardioides guangzhouensis]|uniref:Helix-turn-helix domain-containing protein n=1 Tax=Nocardioides guangzhouensis TaxID=2497878 RepID=A0A4Q4Z5S8_9ACTN|nr:helix-turn-helix domain-containing protein [Nocardioides guangzhouensis]RYP83140.1 hypothetical protein EKO23_20070 [Nocardioides guangzhouensis]
MSAAERFEDESSRDESGEGAGSVLRAAPDVVEVRRNAGVAALVGVVASAVAIAYLARAASTGAVLDWVLALVVGGIGAAYLHAFLDARTPLLLADGQGVRIRLGRAWRGLPWGALASVEHTPRRGLLRDGRLVMVPHNTDRVLAELDAAGRRQSRLSERLYGAPFAMPLGLSTHVVGSEDDLTAALRQLAGDSTRVHEPEPTVEAPREEAVAVEEPADEVVEEPVAPHGHDERDEHAPLIHDPRPGLAAVIGRLAAPLSRRTSGEPEDLHADEADAPDTEPTQPIVASATPAPLRETRGGRRAEVQAEVPVADDEPHGRELRRPGSVNLVEDTQVWSDRVRPIAQPGDAVDPLVIDDFEVEPAADPVIGPDLSAARTRLGLTVDQLAERTRIRPHVIESIEVDDFAPCGGDFYARGHLRTLTRVLGVDAAPLLRAYDDRYADAPINPRRVFEAELATSATGGIRGTRGGPNWSILIAAIMVLVLCWSIARLVMDTPALVQQPSPTLLDGSDGPNRSTPPAPARLTLKTTTDAATHLKVVGGNGKVVFDADVEFGEVHRFDVRSPVVVTASDGGAVAVEVNGNKRGTLGDDGAKASRTFRLG